jgi:hypothetical protein
MPLQRYPKKVFVGAAPRLIHLRQDKPELARRILDRLKQLDPTGAVGWPVVAALAEGLS